MNGRFTTFGTPPLQLGLLAAHVLLLHIDEDIALLLIVPLGLMVMCELASDICIIFILLIEGEIIVANWEGAGLNLTFKSIYKMFQ